MPLLQADSANPFAVILILVFSLGVYFTPTLIAMIRAHHNAFAIGVLNLLLGWTGLGWIAALVWACTAVRGQE